MNNLQRKRKNPDVRRSERTAGDKVGGARRIKPNNLVFAHVAMMTSIEKIVRYEENIRRRTPNTIPVSLIAYGSDNAPAPSVALQRLEMEPG